MVQFNIIFNRFPLLIRNSKRNLYFTKLFSTMGNPTVNIKDGQLRGSTKTLLDGSDYFSFKGIPYAQPPLGKLRFKDPIPVKPWRGIRNAFAHGPICPQYDLFTRQIRPGSEDCLFLNVYTRSIDPTAQKAVMVFIHGGGFMSGSGNTETYGPEFLLQHDVVLVTINYRLEMFGFLCLDIPEVPGNAGMKDQVLALKWVQDNIDQFGGDRNNVTIFGESAGSASVTYHLLSPMSKGLFHKAIAESGTCTMDWAQGFDAKNRAFRVCKLLGRDINDPVQALEFLQSVPAVDLISKTFKSLTKDEEQRGLPLHFVPVVERFTKNSFLLEKPEDILLKGNVAKVPLILGYNSLEGMLSLPVELKKLDYRNRAPSSLVPRAICNNISSEKMHEFGFRIKEFYCQGADWSEEEIEKLLNMMSDLYFTYQVHAFAHHYSKISQTYLYKFNFDTELNVFKSLFGFDVHGASHADELFYIFCNALNRNAYKENEKLKSIIDQISRIWTDFAKTSNPTYSSPAIKWSPYTISEKEHLNIEEGFSMGRNVDKERVEFWNKLYGEVGLMHINKSKL